MKVVFCYVKFFNRKWNPHLNELNIRADIRYEGLGGESTDDTHADPTAERGVAHRHPRTCSLCVEILAGLVGT